MEQIKLQKYFSDCGIMSRRAAEEQIKQGRVKVNGTVATLGQRITPDVDKVEYLGKEIVLENTERTYIMLNKPRGYVTTMSDEKGRHTVSELVGSLGKRVYPIGRLDMDSDGLLLLSDDGELTNKLTHPRHEIPKIYRVSVKERISEAHLNVLRSELIIDGYKILPVETKLIQKEDPAILEMTLYEGRNRQIRKMCEQAELTITRLCRIAIGNVTLGSLEVGKWRHLTKQEVEYLKQGEYKKGNKNA